MFPMELWQIIPSKSLALDQLVQWEDEIAEEEKLVRKEVQAPGNFYLENYFKMNMEELVSFYRQVSAQTNSDYKYSIYFF